MKPARRRFLHLAAGAVALPALSRTASAQAYPVRPVRLVIAFVAGGATDTLARLISNDLGQALGQNIVVENRPGANGYLTWNHVATAEPDGYTLLLAKNALAISQALYKRTVSSFDPLTQYDAIASVATSPSALIVSKNIPATTVDELVAYSRTVPGKMNYASAGVGSVSHLNFEVFKDAVGMDVVHILYKGGGQAIADVLAGHVPMTITSVQATKSLVEGPDQGASGDERATLAGNAKRSHHERGRRERVALLVRPVRTEEHPRGRQGQARKSDRDGHVGRAFAGTAGDRRYQAGLRASPCVANQARKRDQELDEIH
jgi:tripartite-type tricarboxylate transporter receptor subunit TctC